MIIEIHGATIRFERQGTGNPVLLLHGWGASTEAMGSIAACVAALGYEAISLDFPGFGKSGDPPGPWGVPEYAACTRAFMDAVGILGCDVVAHSFGGRVAIWLASEEPAAFHRLILVDAAGIKPRRGLQYYIKVYTYKAGKRLAKIAWLNRLFHIGERQKQAGSAEYRQLRGDMRATYVKVVNLDLSDRLPRIPNETLLIWGEKDQDTPLWMGEKMEREMQNAGLAVIPGAGHFSYAEDYPRFCSIMKILFSGEA
ncbi:MAG: alpha/beta hydrolase [Candidatus Pelethousia sp.]|nr:alpha/beta hydrolase [Candidatus Pelethousia sp.]